MKIIKIDEKTQIAIDGDNYIIQKATVNKKTGLTGWVSKSYFSGIADCATELLDTLPGASSELTEDLKSVVSAVKDAEAKILNAIK